MEQLGLALGVILMIMGAGYLFKAFVAIAQGRIWYWTGFLPLTIISPWLIFCPPNERKEKAIAKVKDAIWAPIFFGPVFTIMGVVCLSAGADMANLPGTSTTNRLLTSWTSDKTPVIVFDKKNYKLQFPAAVKTANKITKIIFGTQAGIKEQDKLLPTGG
ncbi:MAG: hypothetical protein K2Y39_07760 [Candidatus Obscuribacterales bacterium]|nr:hypothetical protein [Candidatus Obscuribacterales bacterium]